MEILIHYSHYIQNGKTIPKSLVQKGDEVVLHVENYNNYLYEVSVDINNEKTSVGGGVVSNILGQLGGGGSPLNFLFKGSDQLLGAFKFFPGLSGKSLATGSGFAASEEDKIRQEKVVRLKKLEADFNAAKENLFELGEELKAMQEEVPFS